MGPNRADVEAGYAFLRVPLEEIGIRLLRMPLANVYYSASAPDADVRLRLLTSLSALLAREVGKPEGYVMTNLVPRCDMTFGGTFDPACYVEIKNIGKFRPEQTQRISARVCELLQQELHVAPSRTYVEFTDATGHLWGFNGSTFG